MHLELLHYSEQDGLDTDALEAQVLSASEASVLLLATAASSYLWFDAEHCPRNVELCTILKKFPEIRVNFVVCPTTESARDGWQQHQSDLKSVFRGFLPETRKVDTWMDFDPDQDIETEQILSVIRRGQHLQSLDSKDVDRPRSGSCWKSVAFVILLCVASSSHKLSPGSSCLVKSGADGESPANANVVASNVSQDAKMGNCDSSESNAKCIVELSPPSTTFASYGTMLSEVDKNSSDSSLLSLQFEVEKFCEESAQEFWDGHDSSVSLGTKLSELGFEFDLEKSLEKEIQSLCANASPTEEDSTSLRRPVEGSLQCAMASLLGPFKAFGHSFQPWLSPAQEAAGRVFRGASQLCSNLKKF